MLNKCENECVNERTYRHGAWGSSTVDIQETVNGFAKATTDATDRRWSIERKRAREKREKKIGNVFKSLPNCLIETMARRWRRFCYKKI